jgi:hypothetical protein
MGASLGLEAVTGISLIGNGKHSYQVLAHYNRILGNAFALTAGSYRTIERIPHSSRYIMSITFITTAVMVKPSVAGIIKGTVYTFGARGVSADAYQSHRNDCGSI